MNYYQKIIRLQDNIDNEILGAIKERDEEFQYVVYRYEHGNYDGNGELICKTKDGKFFEEDLGHCSCYSATDDWKKVKLYNSLEELTKDTSNGWMEQYSIVLEKVRKIETKILKEN